MGNETNGIVVRCACGKALRARMELAGRTAKCPSCGTLLTVPIPPRQTPAAQTPSQSFAPPFVQARPRADNMQAPSMNVVFWVMGAVGLVIVGGIIFMAVRLSHQAAIDRETSIASTYQSAKETTGSNPAPSSNMPAPSQPAAPASPPAADSVSQPAPQTTPEATPAPQGQNPQDITPPPADNSLTTPTPQATPKAEPEKPAGVTTYDGVWEGEAKFDKPDQNCHVYFRIKDGKVNLYFFSQDIVNTTFVAVPSVTMPAPEIRLEDNKIWLKDRRESPGQPALTLEVSGQFNSATAASGKLTISGGGESVTATWTAKKKETPEDASPPKAGGAPETESAPADNAGKAPQANPAESPDWKNDWSAFIDELSPYFQRGARISELKEKFEGQQVTWDGTVSEIDLKAQAPSIVFKMPAKSVTLSDGSKATVDRIVLYPEGGNVKKWESVNPGDNVRFRTTLKGNSLFPVVGLLQGVGPNEGKDMVIISTSDGEMVEMIKGSGASETKPPAAPEGKSENTPETEPAEDGNSQPPVPQTTPAAGPEKQDKAASYDGTWRLKFKEADVQFNVSFAVKDNNVTGIIITVPGEKDFYAQFASWPISNGKFLIDTHIVLPSPNPSLDLVLKGKFESASTASGEMILGVSGVSRSVTWTSEKESQGPQDAPQPSEDKAAPQDKQKDGQAKAQGLSERELFLAASDRVEAAAIAHATSLGVTDAPIDIMMFLATCGEEFIQDESGNVNPNATAKALTAAVLNITPKMIKKARQLTPHTDGDSVKGAILVLLSGARDFLLAGGKFNAANFNAAFENLDNDKVKKAAELVATERHFALCLLLRASARFVDSKGNFDAAAFNKRLDALKQSDFTGSTDEKTALFDKLMKP